MNDPLQTVDEPETVSRTSRVWLDAGWQGHQDFDDLIRILDDEIRLITPTDPEGKDAGEPGGVQGQGEEAQEDK